MAHKDDVRKHLAKVDQIMIRPHRGTKALWQQAAQAAGMSLQAYIITTVEARVQADIAGGDQQP